MIALKRELNLLLLAVGFLTRLPITFQLDYNAQTLNASSRYFTLVGALLGLCMAAVYLGASALFPASVAVLMVLIANLLLTGCFHQDGLADMADGFGGAFQRERKLEVMKDSRLGTYGSSALIATLVGKRCHVALPRALSSTHPTPQTQTRVKPSRYHSRCPLPI